VTQNEKAFQANIENFSLENFHMLAKILMLLDHAGEVTRQKELYVLVTSFMLEISAIF